MTKEEFAAMSELDQVRWKYDITCRELGLMKRKDSLHFDVEYHQKKLDEAEKAMTQVCIDLNAVRQEYSSIFDTEDTQDKLV